MTYKEIIQHAHKTYLHSGDEAELQGVEAQLTSLIRSNRLNEDNKMDAEALSYCIRAKYRTVAYLNAEYAEAQYEALVAYLATAVESLAQTDYANTRNLCHTLLTTVKEVHAFMRDAVELIRQVRDSAGLLATSSQSLLEATLKAFRDKRARAEKLGDTVHIFGPAPMEMTDIGTKVREDVGEACDWLEAELRDLCARETNSFFRDYTKELDLEPGMRDVEYYPPLESRDPVSASTIVLCSPFRDEVLLFVRAFAKCTGRAFLTLYAHGFAAKSAAFIDAVFALLETKKQSCVIFGLCDYRDENASYLAERIIRYSRKGCFAFPVDHKGDRALYDMLYGIAKEKAGLSGLDVSYRFLLLPSFQEVAGELEEKKIITARDHEFLRQKTAFMGYVGFNRIVTLFAQGKKWCDEAVEISARHEGEATRYLQSIPSQEQLLDPAWRSLELKRDKEKPKREFDYDSVRSANPNNIRKILEADIGLFAKCGMMARYCTLHGDDVSVWKTLTTEEKSERLTDASGLVAHLLHNQYMPQVEVVAEDKWDAKGAGGLCCDGGKLIKYRESCCEDYTWTVKAVCHECYHGFQHTLEQQGWLPWHWEELGVTRNRVNEWAYNSAHYRDIAKGKVVYMIQVMEADARTFEEDCFQQSENVYNMIDLE